MAKLNCIFSSISTNAELLKQNIVSKYFEKDVDPARNLHFYKNKFDEHLDIFLLQPVKSRYKKIETLVDHSNSNPNVNVAIFIMDIDYVAELIPTTLKQNLMETKASSILEEINILEEAT